MADRRNFNKPKATLFFQSNEKLESEIERMKKEREINEQLKQEMSDLAESLKGEKKMVFYTCIYASAKNTFIRYLYQNPFLLGLISKEWKKDKEMDDVRTLLIIDCTSPDFNIYFTVYYLLRDTNQIFFRFLGFFSKR